MASLSRIQVHPIKALDPIELESVTVQNGGIEYDRKYAMFNKNDEFVNGKKYERVHELRSEFDPSTEEVTLRAERGNNGKTFHMVKERLELEKWLSDFFGEPISMVESSDTRFTDTAGGSTPMDITAPGPSIISENTYTRMSSWFPKIDINEFRHRFRTNLEISGVPAFWEDNLFSDEKKVVEFQIGDVLIRGVLPLPRCVVPTRNPLTGNRDPDFVETFTERREEQFPEWADAEHLGQKLPNHSQHYFYLTVVTRIPASESGKNLHIGDNIEIIGEETLVKVL